MTWLVTNNNNNKKNAYTHARDFALVHDSSFQFTHFLSMTKSNKLHWLTIDWCVFVCVATVTVTVLLAHSPGPFTIASKTKFHFFAILLTHKHVQAHAHAHTSALTGVHIRQIIQRSEQFSFVLHSREIDVFALRMAWHTKKDWIVLGFFILLIRCFCRSTILLHFFFFSGNISCVVVFVLLVCSIDNESIFYISQMQLNSFHFFLKFLLYNI